MLRVLVLLGDNPVATAVEMELDATGLDVATVPHPDVVQAVRMRAIDAVVLDPGVMADACAEALDRLVGAAKPTLVVSVGGDADADLEFARRVSAGGFLPRPFSPREAVRALLHIVDRSRRSTLTLEPLSFWTRGPSSEPP